MMGAGRWVLEGALLSVLSVLLCLSKPTERPAALLPASLVPEHYEISLSPLLNQNIFQGVVVISGVAVVETTSLVLHCRGLVFNDTRLDDVTAGEVVGVSVIKQDDDLQQCSLLLDQPLSKDHEYRLTLEFMGVIGKEGVGLYRDVYYEDGVKHDILMTHFQPNYARHMFPCFDEPHFKAQFVLRVARHNFSTVISNMPPATSTTLYNPEESQDWVEFEETPPMSSYLLVLVMSDYLSLSDSVSNSSVWAPRSRLHEAQLALNISVAVLQQCESYFGVEHALPKLDHVPVPSLNTVAMENWGAITYKKDFLLWEEGVSTWAQRETISYVVCHEIVHQWLGNLVTTSWWNTTWLNEGVTSFFHYYFMDKIEPSWEVMDATFVTQIQLIFNEEAMRDPKPLTNNEPFASQDSIASDAFSASTYIKGAAIMRMVHSVMDPEIFREAVVQYINENEFQAVDEQDLWQSVAAVADLPVDLEDVMYSWTHQAGYPLVTVVRGRDGCITLTQEKYLSTERGVRWTIPLTYTTSSELNFNSSRVVWFPGDQNKLELPGVCLEKHDWIILNIRQNGFYRVKYDLQTWQQLANTLVHGDLSSIHPVNRGQLLYDSFDLALHGLWPFTRVMDLSRFLRRETEYLPWFVAVQWLNVIKAHLYKTDTFHLFQRYAVSLVDPSFRGLSLRSAAGGLLPELHRKQVVEFACGLHHPSCVKEATDIVYLLMSGVQVHVPVDLTPVLLCSAVRYGQAEVWHFVLKEYLAAAENERWKYLSALACTSSRQTIDRLLKDVADPRSFVKSSEERLSLLMELGKQEDALEPVLDLVLSRFSTLSANFNFEMILHILRTFLTRLPTPQERDKIRQIGSLVSKMQSPKHVELMVSILSDIDKLDFNSLYKDVLKVWLEKELNVTEGDSLPMTSVTSHPTAASATSTQRATTWNNKNDMEEDVSKEIEVGENETESLEDETEGNEEYSDINDAVEDDKNNSTGDAANKLISGLILFLSVLIMFIIR